MAFRITSPLSPPGFRVALRATVVLVAVERAVVDAAGAEEVAAALVGVLTVVVGVEEVLRSTLAELGVVVGEVVAVSVE